MKRTTAGALVGLAGVLAIGARVLQTGSLGRRFRHPLGLDLEALGRRAEAKAERMDPEMPPHIREKLQAAIDGQEVPGVRVVTLNPDLITSWDDLVALGEAEGIPPHVIGQTARALGITPEPVRRLRDAMDTLARTGGTSPWLDVDAVVRDIRLEPEGVRLDPFRLDTWPRQNGKAAQTERLRERAAEHPEEPYWIGDGKDHPPLFSDLDRETQLARVAREMGLLRRSAEDVPDEEADRFHFDPKATPVFSTGQNLQDPSLVDRDIPPAPEPPDIVEVPDALAEAYGPGDLNPRAVLFDGAELDDLTEHGTREDIQGDRLEDPEGLWSGDAGYRRQGF